MRLLVAASAIVASLALCTSAPTQAQSAKPAAKQTKPAPKPAAKSATRRTAPLGATSAKPDAATSHEALVMAYRDNLVTFTKALRAGGGNGIGPVDVIVARPAIAEMRRSYEQMMKQHDAQLEELSGRVDGPAAGVKNQMDARLGRIGTQLAALDLVVNDPTPEPREVETRSAAILKECAGLAPLRTKATR